VGTSKFPGARSLNPLARVGLVRPPAEKCQVHAERPASTASMSAMVAKSAWLEEADLDGSASGGGTSGRARSGTGAAVTVAGPSTPTRAMNR
jgi:hypothetical protein